MGWFVVNIRDADWFRNDAFGTSALYQPPDVAPQLGVNLGVLEPGKPNCLYHEESAQEAFLVLAGQCLIIVDGEEVELKAWDFVHCPPGTRHVLVGSGDGPCAILFIGAPRRPEAQVTYRVDPVAARYGASPAEDTDDPEVAYAGLPAYKPAPRPPGPWDS